ncbi:alkaline phosphatase [Nostoc sp. KVJ20]|uniref:alkaline phosphatase n=2 Tax=unclassified Nostoc TaxID=2593658 RepID=UPI00083D4685|nr:alkaline phosphatase [Nostoc sp. KVJ20]ODG97966.1 alkaline phosphatase [Nostoc sp. KVJ20]
MASFLSAMMLIFGNPVIRPALAAGNGINVILMIGDGMGWNMARAAAIAKGGAFYTAGKGSGLSFQTLTGYGLVTTYGTTIEGSNSVKSTGNSALDGSNSLTGASPVRPGFSFQPTPFNPGNTINGDTSLPGNLAGYDVTKGGPTPWIPLSPANPGNYDKEYIKYSYPDSANTATTLYTGVKSYNNAMGVDIYEQKLTTIVEIAKQQGKSTGVVTSVPVSHATPGAAVSFVNRRNKYDSDYDPNKTNQDSILQQALLNFQPNVILGGGHPLDHQNTTSSGPLCNATSYTYIKASTYKELTGKTALSDAAACSAPASSNPNNRYGYTFLERGPNATQTLLNTAASIDPNTGGKLFGLYGARGQDGNIPTSSSKGDYSTTGLGQFTLYSTTTSTNQTPNPDTVRPLSPGETDASFIAREINENPTLADMTQAALTVLGKDQDGFWLMVEGGDIDWAAHDNNMDNLIGTMNDFDKAVQTTINWINNNGGWSKNLLIVTADHDHYLTLNSNFLSKLTAQDPNVSRDLKFNAKDITFNQHLPANAGHFWGSDPSKKYLWGSHSRRIVPVYYQGANSSILTKFLGQRFQMTDSSGTTYSVPGVRGVVDQTQIFQAMNTALTSGGTPPH